MFLCSNLWPLLDAFFEGITHFAGFGQLCGLLHEFIVDSRLNESARASTAVLSVVGKNRGVGYLCGLVHCKRNCLAPRQKLILTHTVCIVEDHQRTLPTQLQSDVFQVRFGGVLHDFVPDLLCEKSMISNFC